MGVRILAALRDLDPPAGGAEMSLATLLKGMSERGPYAESAPEYIPLESSPDCEEVDGWSVKVFQSSNRGDMTDLTQNSRLEREVCPFPVEDIWSGLAWRLRNKKNGKQHSGLQRRHLAKANRRFAKWLTARINDEVEKAQENGDLLLGVTQLHWSAGAAESFQSANIPYLVFVRDELQFNHKNLYRESLENAKMICGAGHGLLKQIEDRFAINHGAHVPLPVNFAERFGDVTKVNDARQKGLDEREIKGTLETPKVAIVGVTPEKGFEFYQRFLPYLNESWPELEIDIYGGGGYVEALSKFSNVTAHGHTPVDDVFASCDVHFLTVESTGSWGRVINEAGLYGVPSVSVNIGAQPEAVGAGGCIVDADATLEDWSDALRDCYNNRVSYGCAAKEHAKVIDHRRSIAMFRSAIRDALGL